MKHFYTMLLVVGLCFFANSQEPQTKSSGLIRLDRSAASRSSVELMQEKLGLPKDESMQVLKVDTDQLGYVHEKFQHYYKGLKVEGSTYTVHSKDGIPTHMTGNYQTIEDIATTPSISSDIALESAKAAANAKTFAWEETGNKLMGGKVEKPIGELVVVRNTANGYKARLAYKFHVISTEPYTNAYVYVDAITGEVVLYNSILKHAHGHAKPGFVTKENVIEDADAVGTAATRYSGSQSIHTDSYTGGYRLRDYTKGNGVITYDATTATSANSTTGRPNGASEYSDNDNNWTSAEYNNASKDNAGLDAHFAASATYEFFNSNYGRNSYDGNGAVIEQFVNTDIEAVFNYPAGYNDNAFWTGYVMVYGKGNSLDPLTTVDITAHEIGHAYCTGTADLVYQKESGAMNEGLSDIWGACVEWFTNQNYGTNKDIWNLGTEIGQTFRSMSNPKAYGDPDTYGGTNWISQNCTPTSSNDYCGVHTNSGVTNHWFYVLAAGENDTNDLGDSYNVTGIGVSDAAAIVWRTESIYLTSSSNYADFRTYSIQSAVELFGSGSAQEIAVTNAWYAVGVGSAYVATCNLAAPGSFAASNVQDNSFSLSWNAVSGASSYTVTVGSTSSTVTGTSYSVSGLTAGTTYACSVVANCASGGSGALSSINVTTTGTPPLSYCASNGNTTSDEYIGRIQLGSIDNSTGASAGGYGDFTNQSTSLEKSASATITITPTWTGTIYNEGYSVWIDYNQNGVFTDAGEQVWTKAASKTTPVSGSFTVPSTALEGATRMRVSMKYNGIPTSCESFQYGEVEDYTVNITGTAPDTQAPTAPTNLSASNVTQSSLTLSWSASTDNVGVTGYDVYQDGSNIGSVSGTSASITGLAAGISYSFTVRAKDAAGNVSAASSSLNVTTQSAGITCSSTISAYPYSEGFEVNDGWTQITGDDGNWVRDANGTPSSNTGPGSAAEGTYYMFLEASTNGSTGQIGSNATAILESPCFDLSAEAAATFSFQYHMYGNNIGSLTAQASTDGTSWTNVWTISGNQGNTWLTASVDLAAYLGGEVKLRMVGTTGNGWSSDIAIDDLKVTAGSSGGNTDVTLTITFDNYPEETSWQIKSGATVVASGGTYGSQPDGSTLTEVISLAAGCYDFVINDSYGDGICCSYGSGSYSLTDGAATLASGGAFGSSETTPFCVGGAGFTYVGAMEPSSVGVPVRVDMYPNPVPEGSGMLNFTTTRDESTYVISNLNGQQVRKGQLLNGKVDVSDLGSGMYMINLIDTGGKSVFKKFIKQ